MSEQQKRFARCEHCPNCKLVMPGQGWYHWGCFCLPFRGMPVEQIQKCPLMEAKK